MFQPGEECLIGSQNMLENGILENPKVDAALAYHVGPGKLPIGMFMYNDNSTMMYSNNEFSVTVKGKGGHGALPQNCIDPISVGAHIIIALQEIIARELDPHDSCVITVGTFHAGTAMNIIPETARLTGYAARGYQGGTDEAGAARPRGHAGGCRCLWRYRRY